MPQSNIEPIPSLSLGMMAVCAILSMVLFVGLLVWSRRRLEKSPVPFLTGCGTFVVFALILESILHNLVLASPLGPALFSSIWPYAIYGGLAAGIFEETGRLFAMKWLKKKYPAPQTALAYGAGHGGIEVILVLTVTMIQYLSFSIMVNQGAIGTVLESLDEANQAVLVTTLQGLAQANPFTHLLSIAERLSAVVLHIALSVLVWQAAVEPGKLGCYFGAIGIHGAFDAVVVILSKYGVNPLILEALMALMAAGIALAVKKQYQAMW